MRAFFAVVLALAAAAAQAQVALTHVHGLAYSADGSRLMVPSHHGLAIHENGQWSMAPGFQHDYMGFAATAKHLYSSGHPAPGSGHANPFGLIRSRDGGRSWDKLGLQGETDFHLLAAGWNSNAIYVWNPAPSSRLRQTGLHFTTNDGLGWKRAAAAGLAGEPHALAVHPDDPGMLALATSKGVFVSRDAGENFTMRAAGEATAVFFDLDGKQLWYGVHDGQGRLARVGLAGGLTTRIELPPLQGDAVAFIAQNPLRRSEFTVATYGRTVMRSADGGARWTAIAERGRTR